MNGTNKLEFYITLDQKGLPGTNALAYWALSEVMMPQKCRVL
jgi:hypothetical protein